MGYEVERVGEWDLEADCIGNLIGKSRKKDDKWKMEYFFYYLYNRLLVHIIRSLHPCIYCSF